MLEVLIILVVLILIVWIGDRIFPAEVWRTSDMRIIDAQGPVNEDPTIDDLIKDYMPSQSAQKSTITPQQNETGPFVIEKKRKIVFDNGDHLNLRNVTKINHMGTWLRIWSDEGFIVLNPDRILYHIIDGQ